MEETRSNTSKKTAPLALFGLLLTLCAVFGISYEVSSNQGDGGYAEIVVGYIPESETSLRALAANLAEHNKSVHISLKRESGNNYSLESFMNSHRERFAVPAEWFALVAKTGGIPGYKINTLVREAGKGLLSTDEAAEWVLGVHLARKRSLAFEAQQEGVQALRDTRNQAVNIDNQEK